MSQRKFTCGETLPSGCVLFTGELPSFIDEDSISCAQTLDEILAGHAVKIQALLSGNDFSALSSTCISIPLNASAKQLHQLELDKLCNLESRLAAAEAALANFNIGAHMVTMDLGCLTPAGAACVQGTNMYTLLSILTIFKNEICNIKAQL